jgi:hypothetical protein
VTGILTPHRSGSALACRYRSVRAHRRIYICLWTAHRCQKSSSQTSRRKLTRSIKIKFFLEGHIWIFILKNWTYLVCRHRMCFLWSTFIIISDPISKESFYIFMKTTRLSQTSTVGTVDGWSLRRRRSWASHNLAEGVSDVVPAAQIVEGVADSS